ncbi:MAG: GNAT family N-acetyltransferase, partial [Candidatus Cloacimonetes bacterium]|nr:GNAT family N-acetyltransferase [Candidatus Cloacimonadota bacterium]
MADPVFSPGLRRAMHDDRHAMGRLFVRSVHGLARESYAPAQLEAWAPVSDDPPDWITRLESLECWLLELDGRLAGFIAWKPDGLLDLLFTDPEFARRGVASRLLSHMEQTA